MNRRPAARLGRTAAVLATSAAVLAAGSAAASARPAVSTLRTSPPVTADAITADATTAQAPTAPARRLAAEPAGTARAATTTARTTARPVAALACDLVGGLRLCTHGDDSRTARGEAGPQASTASTRVGCYGDGVSGPRVVAAYVRPVGSADRFAQYVDRFRGWAGALERSVDDTAHKTGGARHLRFATTSGAPCSLQILRLTLPADAFGSFAATVRALQERGLDRPGNKYLLWADAKGYCGIASTYDDDRPDADNLNNGSLPTYARVDRQCWGYAEAHEVMHMLGGVSKRAPHGTDGFHCNDGREQMCYDDGSRGGTQRAVCAPEHARLFDCRSDDYFSTSPPKGSWLASHWNVAFSRFLSPSWTEPSTTQEPAPEPAPAEDSEPASILPPLPPVPPLLGGR